MKLCLVLDKIPEESNFIIKKKGVWSKHDLGRIELPEITATKENS